MHPVGKFLWSGAALAISLAGFFSCRKPADAVKSDLSEAGYQLTTADWFRATRANDLAALKKFVAAGFAPDTRDETGDTALHAAAFAGAKDSADFLLDRGLGIDLRGASDRSPLMAAIAGDRTAMVRWLLRQGADPAIKDKDGFLPLMFAVREGKSGAVEELAPYNRENLDSAVLLAALLGRTDVIDVLTNYGASVYARMEDGRSPLMIAAENGHAESVKLLLDIGASRLATDAAGHTAADLATAAGHPEIAVLIHREPLPEELALESPAEVTRSLEAFVDGASTDSELSAAVDESRSTATRTSRSPARPIQGETLSAAATAASTPPEKPASSHPKAVASDGPLRLPPLVMRHYREREVPIQVRSVTGETATLNIIGAGTREVKVHPGEKVPGSNLVVVRVQRRMENSKVTLGKPAEISVVEVRDSNTGITREWISGVPSNAHDPVALIEDAATGQRYTATPGQRFKSADGTEFIISDVRPNQIVIQGAAGGAVQTIPLRGPRG